MIRFSSFFLARFARQAWSRSPGARGLGLLVLTIGAGANIALLPTPHSMRIVSPRVRAPALASQLVRTNDDSPLTAITGRVESMPSVSFAEGDGSSTFSMAIFRFNGQEDAPVFTLQQNQPLTPSTVWTDVDPETTMLQGLPAALWIAQHAQDNKPVLEDHDKELAAEQAAIWANTNDFRLDSSNIPDTVILQRALQLYEQAPQSYAPSHIENELGIAASLTYIGPSSITVTVRLYDFDNSSFDHSMPLTLHAEGRSVNINTGRQIYIDVYRQGWRLIADDRGASSDNNTAVIQMPRNETQTEVYFDWQVEIPSGTLLIAPAYGTSPVITTQPFDVKFSTNINLDPSKYPSAEKIVSNEALFWIARLNPWQSWAAIIGLVIVLPTLSAIITSRLTSRKQ